ncbi:MAG: septum formation family protein [Chloroflexi bacterium]|nr:septum formation family protein [Chloroflexota bacterium]
MVRMLRMVRMPRIRAPWLLALTVAMLGVACTTGATRSDDGSIVEPGSLSVFSMAAGDCFDDPDGLGPDGLLVGSVSALPCTERHDNEVFAVYRIPGPADTAYPGDERIYDLGRNGCLDRFAAYVGIEYEQSRFEIDSIIPTEQSWSVEDDREVVCYLYALLLAPIEGSMWRARQ